MSIEQTRQLWERFKSAEAHWSDPAPMVALHSEDIRLNDGQVRGRAALHAFESGLRCAFPDWKRDYLEVVIGQNAIAFRWCARATHLGALFGHEPTGRRIELRGASFMRIGDDGLIQESHTINDPQQMWQQLGLPSPGGNGQDTGSTKARSAMRGYKDGERQALRELRKAMREAEAVVRGLQGGSETAQEAIGDASPTGGRRVGTVARRMGEFGPRSWGRWAGRRRSAGHGNPAPGVRETRPARR